MSIRSKLSSLFGMTVLIVLGLLWTQQLLSRRVDSLRRRLEWSRTQLVELNSLYATVSGQIHLVSVGRGRDSAEALSRIALQSSDNLVQRKFYTLERHLFQGVEFFNEEAGEFGGDRNLSTFEGKTLAELRRHYARINKELKLILNLDRRHNREIAAERLQELINGVFTADFARTIEAWIEHEDIKMQEIDMLADVLHERANIAAMSMSVAGLIAVLLLAFTARVAITRSLAGLLEGTERIARGDLQSRINIKGNNELSWLAATFNWMSTELHEHMVSRDFLNSIITSMADTLIVLDCNGRIQEANTAACRLLGYDQKKLKGMSIDEICPRIAEFNADTDSATAAQIETVYRAADSREIPVLFSRSKLYDKTGRETGAICLALDITELNRMREERRQMELRLAHAEKLEAIGQLAGGIAHDFNNQLTSIIGYAELLSEHLADEPEMAGAADIIAQSSRDSAGLIQELLSFARKGPIEMHRKDLHEIINNTVKLLKHSLSGRVKVNLDLHASNSLVMADSGKLQNALLNLAINARDAVAESGGELLFATHNLSIDEAWRQTNGQQLANGEYINLSVKDNGSGIPLEIISKVFEPFFSTKPEGKGTGMGLAAVYGTIKSHQGEIILKSEVGRGTTFEIILPRLETESA